MGMAAAASRFRASLPTVLLDTPPATRILSIEALFLEPGWSCALKPARPGNLGFQRKAVSNRKQTAVGSQLGVGAGWMLRPRLAPAGPSFQRLGRNQSAAQIGLDVPGDKILFAGFRQMAGQVCALLKCRAESAARADKRRVWG